MPRLAGEVYFGIPVTYGKVKQIDVRMGVVDDPYQYKRLELKKYPAGWAIILPARSRTSISSAVQPTDEHPRTISDGLTLPNAKRIAEEILRAASTTERLETLRTAEGKPDWMSHMTR